MTTTKTKTLLEKLIEVAASVRNIEKGGRNEAQNYSFVQEADVVRTVWPLLLERGILFFPAMRTVYSIVEYKTKSGADSFLTTVESNWTATDGTSEITVASMGQGTDTGGDKGVYKALTGDKKYAVLQLLGIATGDDPEVANNNEANEAKAQSAPAQPKLSHEQIALLRDEAAKAGFDPTDMEKAAALGQYIFDWTGKKALSDLDNDDLTKILENLREIQTVAGAVTA